MNKIITIGLLLFSVFLMIIPLTSSVDAQSDKDNPYSFHWWYSNQQHPDEYIPLDPDTYDYANDNKYDKIEIREDVRYCANSGQWDGEKCIIDDPEEQAAYEDAVCDDPKNTEKYAKLCGGGSSKDNDDNDNDDVDIKPVAIATIPYNGGDNDAGDKDDDDDDSNSIIAKASKTFRDLQQQQSDDDDKDDNSNDQKNNSNDDSSVKTADNSNDDNSDNSKKDSDKDDKDDNDSNSDGDSDDSGDKESDKGTSD
jgi:hypothetical protein